MNVVKRLRRYEGKSMSGRNRPTNPHITAREAIELADYIKSMRERVDFLESALKQCVEAMQWDVGGEPLPSLELEAYENAKRVIAEVRGYE
jgi:hypothetical protein